MATVTSRDVQEIVSKLSSDKAKTREEGIKLLNTWLEGERSTGFVRYIGQKTAMLKPTESWPFLITLLTKCVALEISLSKRFGDFSCRVGADSVKNSTQSNPKEDVFRCILTLHSLLENPPGDFPSNLQEDIVKGIVTIISFVRYEGKLSRKLIECVNTYLLKDDPNLGCQSLEIHDAVKQFAFRYWTTTHDHGLKDALILYARLQLNLTRGAADTVSTACLHTTKAPLAEKRARKEHAAAYIREGLMNGRWLCAWSDLIKGVVCDRIAAFCCLSRNYGTRISKDLFAYWFDGICASFERIMNGATVSHTYDCLLWALRSLHQLSSVLLLSVPRMEASSNETDRSWHTIWRSLMSGLPVFSNVASVADAALIVLGGIISNFFGFSYRLSSSKLFLVFLLPVLCFISCYFSRRGSQVSKDSFLDGDLRDNLHLRQNLLRAILALVNWQCSNRVLTPRFFFIQPLIFFRSKHHILMQDCPLLNEGLVGFLPAADCPMLNEGLVRFLPAAVYALCAGFAPLPLNCKELFLYHSSMDVLVEECIKGEDFENDSLHELFKCSVEALAKIDHGSVLEVCQSHCYRNVRLPRQLRVPLLQEMETYILEALLDKELVQKLLCDLFYKCALVSSFMFGSYITRTRVREEVSPFFAKMGQHLLKLFDCAISVIEKSHNDVRTDQNVIDVTVYTALSQSIERLLNALVKLYEECSPTAPNFQSEIELPDFPASISCIPTSLSNSSISMIMDMELDLSEDSKDLDAIAVGRKTVRAPAQFCELNDLLMETQAGLRLGLGTLCLDLSLLGLIFAIRLGVLVVNQNRLSVLEALFYWTDKVCKVYILMFNLFIIDFQSLILLRDLLNRVVVNDLFDWSGRSKLIDCISNFILVRPHIGQTMIEKLLKMLQDPDYRVRFYLARRIGTLFLTWDGHDDLFQDICSNFGAKLVVLSKEKVVTAKEVLAAVPQHCPTMETIIITLMHLAMFSEKIELEAVFMMCVISAIDPSQRELVVAALDNLSRQLQYTSRSKMMDEIADMEIWGKICESIWKLKKHNIRRGKIAENPASTEEDDDDSRGEVAGARCPHGGSCQMTLALDLDLPMFVICFWLSDLYYFCWEEHCRSSSVIDMIKIFRRDRVFMVMVLSLDYAD
ncbi:hypothetical protein RHGRI_005087 [Rhododendron griersonianum]|uniref:ARM repeat superfamily protein n=1 Tax=Rhododendron griersonianum TaxID=479676 RepID=A0AAV6LBQ9_9ERIC|nr:hypothetical protein RHGRI_005087 [Rhododendron griersonianum]